MKYLIWHQNIYLPIAFKYLVIYYICYSIFRKMDIVKSIQPIFFILLCFSTPCLGLFLFDYSEIKQMNVYKDFGNISIVAILIIFVTIVLLIKIVHFKIFDLSIRKTMFPIGNKETSFNTYFYIAAIELVAYGTIPMAFSVALRLSFLSFLLTCIVWYVFLLMLTFIGHLIYSNSNKKVRHQ